MSEVDVWWDREKMESRGRTFLREIRDAITAAERLVLLVGPQAGVSDYVEMEWRHALQHGVVVTPVLRRGDYGDVPTALASLHCEDARPPIREDESFRRIRRIASTTPPQWGR